MTDSAMPEDGAGVARIDDAVVVEPGRQEERERLGLDLLLDRRAQLRGGVLVVRQATGSGALPADDVEHAGQLRRAHDGALGVGPGEQEARAVRPAAHAVIACAVGRSERHGQMRNLAVGDGIDHLRAGLDDAALLVLGADHVAGGVLQEEQRGVALVGELDELGRLLRLLAKEHARAHSPGFPAEIRGCSPIPVTSDVP